MGDQSLSFRAKKKVKDQMEKAEREKTLKLFQRRMELARDGALAFRSGKYKESLANYFAYIDILEKTKGTPKDGLMPKHFDAKKDIAELLLLSGVFWDLAKIHDQGKKNEAKLKFYLDRFVMFSSGMPFEKISAELVRKFLVNGNVNHRATFKDTHIRLGGSKCFVVTAVSEYCEPVTLPTLRKYRDERLSKSLVGRIGIWLYYRVGPTFARAVIRLPKPMQKRFALTFDRVARRLSRSNSD